MSRPLTPHRPAAFGLLRRIILSVATLGGLALCAGSASAATSPLRWSSRHQADFVGNLSLGSLTCIGQGSCVALDSAGRLVSFASDPDQTAPNDISAHYTTVALDPPDPLTGMACAGGTCAAIDRTGSVVPFSLGSLYRGFHYTRIDPALTNATAAQSPPAIACASSTQCVVADALGGVVNFSAADPAAASRTVLDHAGGTGLVAIACPGSTQCTAISATQAWTFNPDDPSASSTATIDAAPAAATALTCPTISQCTAVDSDGRETTFDPQTPGVPTPVGVSTGANFSTALCVSTTLCTAADQNGQLDSFDPRSGTPISSVPTTGVDSLACVSGDYCIAGDSAGQVVPFTPGSSVNDDGNATSLDGGAPLTGVSCPLADRCVAVSPRNEAIFDPFDPSYGQINTISTHGADPITDLACPKLSLCSIVAGPLQVAFNPFRFRHPRREVSDPARGASFTAVRCPTSAECVGADSVGNALTYDPASGHVDRSAIHVSSGHVLTGLGCPSSTQCTAVDNDGTQITFDPLTGRRLFAWHIDHRVGLDLPSIPYDHELDGISCHSTTSCVAVDTRGDEVSFDPRSRRGVSLHRLDDFAGLTAADCPARRLCVLTGADGRVFTGRPGGLRWTATRLSEATALTAVTCQSGSECVVTDNVGDEYASRAQRPGPGRAGLGASREPHVRAGADGRKASLLGSAS